MGVIVVGPISRNVDSEAAGLSLLFTAPRKAYKNQNAVRNFNEFIACAIARARALSFQGGVVQGLPKEVAPVEKIGRWIVFPNGDILPAIGSTYSDEFVWVINPDNPLCVTQLSRNECGTKWWASFGLNPRQALANRASEEVAQHCNVIKNGRNPNNVLRGTWT